jgi:hypothetical protein
MMTRRTSEITRGGLNRKWPHRVEVPAEKVHDPVNREVIFCAVVVASWAFGVAGFLHATAHDHFDRRSGARKFDTEIFPPTIARRFISVLLRVRVLVVLGRNAIAVHPASSAVGHEDVVRMEPLLPPVMMLVAPVGVVRRG